MLQALLDHGHDIRHLPPWPEGNLHCITLGAGYEQRRNEVYSWDGMRRGSLPFLVLQHTVLGEGRLEYGGAHYRLAPGQCMLVSVPQAHRYYLQRGGHWEYFWMILSGREAMRLGRAVIDAGGPVLDLSPALADRLAAACLSLMAAPQVTPGLASSAGYAAMAVLHDAVFAARDGAAPLPAPIARVLAFVDDNLSSALPVDRLADVAGISRAHFVRRFTAATGRAPSDWVLDRRIDRIERLLLATELRVAEIAAATGFADANYLAKTFRRRRGMAPLAFRATRSGVT